MIPRLHLISQHVLSVRIWNNRNVALSPIRLLLGFVPQLARKDSPDSQKRVNMLPDHSVQVGIYCRLKIAGTDQYSRRNSSCHPSLFLRVSGPRSLLNRTPNSAAADRKTIWSRCLNES